MKNVKFAVLTSVWMTLGILSACGPATEQEAAARTADVASQSQAVCTIGFCTVDSDCAPCPEAIAVSCNANVCDYTYSSGGGGGGGGTCDGAFCTSDADCASHCTTSTA